MATTTYEPIATQTLNSANANITFTAIPQTYTDLIVVFNGSSTGTAQYFMQVGNGSIDTGSNYSTTGLTGNGSSAVSIRYTNDTVGIRADLYATAGGNIKQTIFQIQNYSNTTTNKAILVRSSLPVSESVACIGLYRSTSAINTLRLTTSSTFSTGATVTLYGIANADIGAKASGGIITYDSTYYYHTFGSSGTFTPQTNLTNVDYLVIAGGGAGGGTIGYAGGGGAGGLRSTVSATGGGGSLESKISLNSGTAYTVTVGAGGGSGSNGGNSSIAGSGLTTITSTGGGCGGYFTGSVYLNPTSGGSGGGGNLSGGGSTGGAASPAGQGYPGGNTGSSAGGGGGGAASAGGNGASMVAGVGGSALTLSAFAIPTGTGFVNQYAGGGGTSVNSQTVSSVGGGGGAGNGRWDAIGESAIVNTGSGGGGGGSGNFDGGRGGSGIVIIRYLK